jgi:F-type H+-transporting ATPase subunit delta
MTVTAIAARYAEALAELVTAAGSPVRPQESVDEIRAFVSTLESSNELYIALTSPAVPLSRKKAVIGRIADDLQISGVIRNFLFVVTGHGRIPALAQILQVFEEALDERLGFVRAEVASARELSGEQRAALARTLEHLSGKHVRMRFQIEESLIGGVVAQIGSTVYDGSVRGQLQLLERSLVRQE